jgi:hypothetical protein
MALFLICFAIGWTLTPYVIGILWLLIYVAPFAAILNREPAGTVAVLFFVSALLTGNALYAIGLLTTLFFMLLSAVAAAASAYVTSISADVAIILATGMLIAVAFLWWKQADAANEQQQRQSTGQFSFAYDPHFGFTKRARVIEQGVAAPRSSYPSRKLRTRMPGVLARLRRRFSRPLRDGDLVECVEPAGDLVAGLYTVRSRTNGFVQLWEIDGGWELRRFRRWAS